MKSIVDTSRVPPFLKTFVNAWGMAVDADHNKYLEWLNNPTQDVFYEKIKCGERLAKLHIFARKRWGSERVGSLIKGKELG